MKAKPYRVGILSILYQKWRNSVSGYTKTAKHGDVFHKNKNYYNNRYEIADKAALLNDAHIIANGWITNFLSNTYK